MSIGDNHPRVRKTTTAHSAYQEVAAAEGESVAEAEVKDLLRLRRLDAEISKRRARQ